MKELGIVNWKNSHAIRLANDNNNNLNLLYNNSKFPIMGFLLIQSR